LPKQFHSSDSFDHALAIFKNAMEDSAIFESGKIDSPLLLLGLMFREVFRAIEAEAPFKAPMELVNSPFGIQEIKRIESLIEGVSLPSCE
jgi:hypothetical protein